MMRKPPICDIAIVAVVWGLVASLIVWSLRIGKYIGG